MTFYTCTNPVGNHDYLTFDASTTITSNMVLRYSFPIEQFYSIVYSSIALLIGLLVNTCQQQASTYGILGLWNRVNGHEYIAFVCTL